MHCSAELRIVLCNRIGEITEAAVAVERFLAACAVPDDAILQINLAIEELLTNTISYGYPDQGSSSIRLVLSAGEGEIGIAIEDDALPFDPLARAPADVTAGIEDRDIGGLGIHLVKQLTDGVEYRRAHGRNQVRLRKFFTPAGAAIRAETVGLSAPDQEDQR